MLREQDCGAVAVMQFENQGIASAMPTTAEAPSALAAEVCLAGLATEAGFKLHIATSCLKAYRDTNLFSNCTTTDR